MRVQFITSVEILIGEEKLVISQNEANQLLTKLKNLLEPQKQPELESGVPFSTLSETACSSCCDSAIRKNKDKIFKASKKEMYESQKRN